MKSALISFLTPLLCSRLIAGAAIVSTQTTARRNSSLLTDDSDAHCSNNFALYGQQYPGSVACILALHDMQQDRAFTTIPGMYPIEFLSSIAPPAQLGNGIRTPRRYTYGECLRAISSPVAFGVHKSSGLPASDDRSVYCSYSLTQRSSSHLYT